MRGRGLNPVRGWRAAGIISKGWDAIRDGIAGAWQSIRVAVSQKWDELVNSASTLPERFKEAGSNMISALLEGIAAKWDALKARLSSMTDLLPGFMKPSADKGGATPVNPLSPASPTGFAGLFDNGGYIPAGQYGIAGENGPELVNGPARITSRRRTAALAASAALALGMAAAPAAASQLHPMSLPAQAYQSKAPRAQTAQPVAAPQINASFTIVQQPGESQDDLVDKVMRRLKAEQRQAEARARSSYRDQGGFDE
ncbi:hypothetical protein [Pantoea stewartii]|uniref:hypothetical protein n=1 Tax=Pantoea stewartii TaxID=66269 RepID=UPI00386962F1